jgi:glycosyltransferase involved in cell wall biosynthesis
VSRPMRITYLLYDAYGLGGTVRTVVTQANVMAARGHDVEIASMWRTAREPHFPIDDRVRVVLLADPYTPPEAGAAAAEDTSWHQFFPEKVSADRDSRRRVNALIEYLRGVKEGILVSTRPTIALIAERYASADLVRVVQEHAGFVSHKGVWRDAIDAAYTSFDAIVTLTGEDQLAYQEAFPESLRVERIPNLLASLDVPRSDQTRKIVMATGRLDRAKGFHHLINAFATVVERHPDWSLRIFGRGPEERRLRKMVLDGHLYNHVFLMGSTHHVEEELAKGSIFAMSSRSEGFGMSLLEALNAGLATVSFDCPIGPREILTHGKDGLLVPLGDEAALADALIKVIEDEELRRSLAAAGVKSAARYGPDEIADAWEELFTELSAVKS